MKQLRDQGVSKIGQGGFSGSHDVWGSSQQGLKTGQPGVETSGGFLSLSHPVLAAVTRVGSGDPSQLLLGLKLPTTWWARSQKEAPGRERPDS